MIRPFSMLFGRIIHNYGSESIKKQLFSRNFHTSLVPQVGQAYKANKAIHVLGWGSPYWGELAGEQREVIKLPTPIKHINDLNLTSIVAGPTFCAGLSGKKIFMWGNGRLGLNSNAKYSPGVHTFTVDIPVDTMVASNTHIHVLPTACLPGDITYNQFLNTNDQIQTIMQPAINFACFLNSKSQLFIHHQKRTVLQKHITSPIVSWAAGWGHVLVLDAAGVIWTCGLSNYGQCGRGIVQQAPHFTIAISPIPTTNDLASALEEIELPSELLEFSPIEYFTSNGIKISQIAAGAMHSVAIDEAGRLYTWGSYKDGKLGIETEMDAPWPTIVPYFKDKPVKSIWAGGEQTFAMLHDGSVHSWGFPQHYALGRESTGNDGTPHPCPLIKSPDCILAGYDFGFALYQSNNSM